MDYFEGQGSQVCLAGPNEQEEALAKLGFAGLPGEGRARAGAHFESHEGFDYLTIRLPAEGGRGGAAVLYWRKDAMLVLADEKLNAMQQLRRLLEKPGETLPGPAQCLYRFIFALIEGDSERLTKLEDELEKLEESSHQMPPRNNTRRISAVRRLLLHYKHYYDGLYDALDEVQENDNGFFTKADLRLLHLNDKRVDRLAGAVAGLREYAAQVREIYQNQLDLSMNQTMKVLTVMQGVFLPLTLIAGWYGMNFSMPEYRWAGSYPLLVVFCVVLVLATMWVFKRKKWF